ncbi:hypothetical protein B484DRAFT_435063 [Ochromonadaceae sp. CCMP2298]|nr:hypothetical protein B484DRAFT_435063 [Ochromonadaceae sp. CCMP2298]
MLSTSISLFAGFSITADNFPSFWIFMYWLDPLHYATEGLTVTQFYADATPITVSGMGATYATTASAFVSEQYPEWKYKHRGGDVLALVLFILFLRTGTYLALTYLRHDKR